MLIMTMTEDDDDDGWMDANVPVTRMLLTEHIIATTIFTIDNDSINGHTNRTTETLTANSRTTTSIAVKILPYEGTECHDNFG